MLVVVMDSFQNLEQKEKMTNLSLLQTSNFEQDEHMTSLTQKPWTTFIVTNLKP